LTFFVQKYFKDQGKSSLYPYIDIIFEMNEKEHYHIPLLLNPYGYSTYKGS